MRLTVAAVGSWVMAQAPAGGVEKRSGFSKIANLRNEPAIWRNLRFGATAFPERYSQIDTMNLRSVLKPAMVRPNRHPRLSDSDGGRRGAACSDRGRPPHEFPERYSKIV